MKKHIKEKTKGGSFQLIENWKFTLEDIITGKKKVYRAKNVITTVGKTMIINNLSNSVPDNSLLVNYVALGTDDTAPAAADVALGAETYRKLILSRTNNGVVGYFSGFFTATEVTGTFKEFGLFSDASDVADSGILLSHVAINITKTNIQTLTVDVTITAT